MSTADEINKALEQIWDAVVLIERDDSKRQKIFHECSIVHELKRKLLKDKINQMIYNSLSSSCSVEDLYAYKNKATQLLGMCGGPLYGPLSGLANGLKVSVEDKLKELEDAKHNSQEADEKSDKATLEDLEEKVKALENDLREIWKKIFAENPGETKEAKELRCVLFNTTHDVPGLQRNKLAAEINQTILKLEEDNQDLGEYKQKAADFIGLCDGPLYGPLSGLAKQLQNRVKKKQQQQQQITSDEECAQRLYARDLAARNEHRALKKEYVS